MRLIGALLIAALAFSAHARVHTLADGVRMIQKDQASSQLLIYKVKNLETEIRSQQWQPFLAKNQFATSALFPRLSRMSATDKRVLALNTRQDVNEFSRYFVRSFPEGLTKEQQIEELNRIYSDGNVEYAYFEVKAVDAVMPKASRVRPLNVEQTPVVQAPAQQPAPQDYESQQFYLNPAPEGVDARYAWNIEGGTGKGIRIIDVETGWHTNHFEFGPVFYDNGKNAFTDHGTAVWGEVAARRDGIGVTGIAYDVEWGIAANGFKGFGDYPVTIAAVIENAAMQMVAGDILVIEQHAPLVDDYGPIEYFEPVFKILQLTVAKGVHCIAAAGNGYSDLDDPKYNKAFDLATRDSGCVIVGAADSPKSSRVRQRSSFSDYGSRVDAFGYGEDVVTAGYGDLFDGEYQTKLASYTNSFSGTSSATPIVTGAVATILGIAKVRGKVITPAEMRAALRATGTPQEGDVSERIGNLPNIVQLYTHFFPEPVQ
jgi:serine protease